MRSCNVPALRLEGFEGAWELKAIGDLSGRTYGGGTPSSDEPGYWSGDIPWIQSSDVAEQGVAPVAPRKYITREAISRSATRQIPANSVAVVTRVGVGKVSFMPFPYATSQDFVSLSDLSGNPEYIALTVKRRMEGLADQLQGSTIKGITKAELLNQAVHFPPTLEEQQAIGAIFANLDAAINQHTKKRQALQQAKTALMQRMFPQEGQTVPELRLEGFDGEWNKSTIGSQTEVVMGQSPHGNSYNTKAVGEILVQGNADLADGWVTPRVWTTEPTRIAEPGTLIMSVRAPVGAMGKTRHRVVLGRGVAGIKGNEFIFQYLTMLEQDGYWSSKSSGSTFDSVNGTEVRSTRISVPPTLEEQQAIGAVFTQLDALIATEAKYIDSLKQAKTALLQQMFI
ncbi:restriction endonuclease subunit S [Corynebacterium diphtheriae]|uniref:restriction endonuclease subunit S n=1 Tax=Corynebacterium diphtheriae TaxID=1717 RepID=UPI0011D18C61|nr:restriction endonuclease subunit S [Corynebacterium diphtheriae]